MVMMPGMDFIITILWFIVIALTITFFLLGIRKRRNQLFLGVSALGCILTILTPVIGHTEWNRQWEYARDIGHLPGFLNHSPVSNAEAVLQLSKDASHVTFVSYLGKTTKPAKSCLAVFKVDGTLYDIGFYDSNTPFGWTPYEYWAISSVRFHHS